MNRRDMLRAGVALAATAALPRWSTKAAAAPSASGGRNLLVVFAYGGWDTTYVLDPKPKGGKIDAPDADIVRIGNIPVATHASRPKVRQFFEAFGGITAVVNGIQVRSIAHDECIKRILTGTASADNADIAATAAHELGRDMPVPYLVLGPLAMSGALGAIVGRTGSVNQLRSLVVPDAEYPAPRGLAPVASVRPSDGEDALVRAYLQASAERQRAVRGMRAGNERQLGDFVRSLEREGLLRRFVKDNGGFGDFAYTPDLAVQSEIAVRAIQRGLSHSVMLGGGLELDTHDDNSAQSMLQDRLFGNLLDLGAMLRKENLLERTTVLVISEMGRTPKLNVTRGKDHWPVTSALVFGGGVAGNRVVGATDDALGAVSIDLATGAPALGGKQLQTGNLAAAVLRITGVDATKTHPTSEPLDAIVA